ncbi:MAG TPA: hypothetical protein VFH97_07075, partial [Gemmatimonadales bacterium]|nr:hypothetical protein [Gemmatimonadales bacterium]
GNTALLVVSTNFDLQYDPGVGGTVLSVDPDVSGDSRPPPLGGSGDPTLRVLGHVNIGSFGGEIDYVQGFDHATGQPACNAMTGLVPPDPVIAADGAYVVATSRSLQEVYRITMGADGSLSCEGCGQKTDPAAYDPFGVTVACASEGGLHGAKAYVTHLRSPGNRGYLSELDFETGRLGPGPLLPFSTYSSSYDPAHRRLFVSTRLGTLDTNPLSWFDVLLPSTAISFRNVSQDLTGSLPRGMAVSEDGLTGYLVVELFDRIVASQVGGLVAIGGGLAIYDLSQTALGDPAMKFQGLVPTCLGSGQVRRIGRSGKRDLVAVTCDFENALLLYDHESGAVAARIALGPGGRPALGRQPFGLAVEPREAGRCLSGSGSCVRLYVASFDQSWVNVLELDPGAPSSLSLVKRIGGERL